MKNKLLIAAMIVFGAALPGCGDDFCALAGECVGWSDEEVDECEAREDYESEIADIHDCGSEYDAMLDCRAEKAKCDSCGDVYGVSEDGSDDCYGFADSDDCDNEYDDLDDCVD